MTESRLDIAALRAATPGCANVAHLNNAGASLPDAATLSRVIAHLRREAEIGGYEAAAEVAQENDDVRAAGAALLGAHRDEVAIVGSDTQAFMKLLWGWVLGGNLPMGATVLVDRLTYNSHYMALLQVQRQLSIRIDVAPADVHGVVDVDAFRSRFELGDVMLVCGTFLGTHSGTLNPAAQMGRVCRDAGVPYFLDACQALGQLPCDVGLLGCDALTGTGRKWLRGPRGTGLLFARREICERCIPPGIDGESATWIDTDSYSLNDGARRFEEFEVPLAAQLGLGVALRQAVQLGVGHIAARVGALAGRLRAGLAGFAVVHDHPFRSGGIVTFSVPGIEPMVAVAAARLRGINIDTSTAPSARLDMEPKRLDQVVRASPHYYNTEAEVDLLIDVVSGLRP